VLCITPSIRLLSLHPVHSHAIAPGRRTSGDPFPSQLPTVAPLPVDRAVFGPVLRVIIFDRRHVA
jgi:hypothetical protein